MDDTVQNGLNEEKNVDYLEQPSPGAEAALFKSTPAIRESFSGGAAAKEMRTPASQILSSESNNPAPQDSKRADEVRHLLGIDKGKDTGSRYDVRARDGGRFQIDLPPNATMGDFKDALRNVGADELAEQAHSVTPRPTVAERVKGFLKGAISFVNETVTRAGKGEEWVYTSETGETVNLKVPKNPGIADIKAALERAGRKDLAEQAASMTPHEEE